ncbi:MurR/RpiR family transcriptional regulator [Nocardioides sp. AN3]
MDDVREVVSARVGDLTPAEKRCARVLLADYPAAGLGSAAALASAAGTSIPTVLRFVGHLGFGTYRDFQQRLREEVTRAAMSPVQRAARSRDGVSATGLSAAVERRISVARELLETVPTAEFDAAVSLLAAQPKSVLLAGGFFSRHLAALLASQLNQLLKGVDYTPDPLARDIGKYLDLGRDGVVVLFDFRRYEDSARRVAELTKKRGARLIMVTDHELSPTADFADVVLPVYVDGVPFDSDGGVVILLESLVECLFDALGATAIRRMSRWEESVKVTRAFAKPVSLE